MLVGTQPATTPNILLSFYPDVFHMAHFLHCVHNVQIQCHCFLQRSTLRFKLLYGGIPNSFEARSVVPISPIAYNKVRPVRYNVSWWCLEMGKYLAIRVRYINPLTDYVISIHHQPQRGLHAVTTLSSNVGRIPVRV